VVKLEILKNEKDRTPEGDTSHFSSFGFGFTNAAGTRPRGAVCPACAAGFLWNAPREKSKLFHVGILIVVVVVRRAFAVRQKRADVQLLVHLIWVSQQIPYQGV
jgi:hypothetical protein